MSSVGSPLIVTVGYSKLWLELFSFDSFSQFVAKSSKGSTFEEIYTFSSNTLVRVFIIVTIYVGYGYIKLLEQIFNIIIIYCSLLSCIHNYLRQE